MTGIGTIGDLRALLGAQGVRTAWVKKLSPKQDNQKNQIYLGGGLDGVTNGAVSLIATCLRSTELSPSPACFRP